LRVRSDLSAPYALDIFVAGGAARGKADGPFPHHKIRAFYEEQDQDQPFVSMGFRKMSEASLNVLPYDVADVVSHLGEEIERRRVERGQLPGSRLAARVRRIQWSAARRVKRLLRKVKKPFFPTYW
jgi:hypothetical protein